MSKGFSSQVKTDCTSKKAESYQPPTKFSIRYWLTALSLIGLLGLFSSSALAAINLLDDVSNTSLNNYGLGRVIGNGGTGGSLALAYVSMTTTASPLGNKDYSMEIQYNADTAGNYIWLVEQLTGAGDIDLSNYAYFAFWVRGAAGGEGFQIGIGNSSFIESRVQVNDFLSNGITTTWQKVVIPFTVLEYSSSWNRGASCKVVIVVDNTALRGASSGTFYIDDFTFGVAAAPLWIDNFDDGVDPNACRGTNPNFGTDISSSYNNTIFSSSPYSRQMDYNLVSSTGTFVHFTNNIDISQCTHLQFDVRGATGNENPNARVRDALGADHTVPIANYGVVPSGSFTTLSIPLSDFVSPTNLTSVPEVDFDVAGIVSSIYVDNLRVVDTSLPSAPSSMLFNSSPVTDGFNITTQSGNVVVTAAAVNADAKMEAVKFEYSDDGGVTWATIADDYSDTNTKTSFVAFWDLSGLPNATYRLKATAFHVGGTSAELAYNVNLNYGTPTNTPSITITPTITVTATATPSATPTPSVTPTATHSPVFSSTITPTNSTTVTISPTSSVSPTRTPTLTASATVTNSPTISLTPTISATHTVSPTISLTATVTQTYTPAAPDDSSVQLSRNSFNPARGDSLLLRVALKESGQLKIMLYNRVGEKVKDLVNREYNSGTWDLSWDGKNSRGEIVPSGIYIIFVKAPGIEKKYLVAIIK